MGYIYNQFSNLPAIAAFQSSISLSYLCMSAFFTRLRAGLLTSSNACLRVKADTTGAQTQHLGANTPSFILHSILSEVIGKLLSHAISV